MYDSKKTPAILITGASTGIGFTCAVRLAKIGYRVYGGVRRSADARRLDEAHDFITPIALDVTNPMQIQNAVDLITREVGEGNFLGLVNNAGIAVAGPLEYVPIGELRKQFDVNVFGLMAVTQAFMPLLRSSSGRIVHISSNSGKVSTPFTGPYCASKFAVEALADAMRGELYGSGVEISLVEPGAIDTPIWEKSSDYAERMLEGMPPEATTHYGKAFEALRASITTVSKRTSPPDLVARAVEHALTAQSPRTRYVVGLDAKLQLFLARFLTDRMLDWVIAKAMGLR